MRLSHFLEIGRTVAAKYRADLQQGTLCRVRFNQAENGTEWMHEVSVIRPNTTDFASVYIHYNEADAPRQNWMILTIFAMHGNANRHEWPVLITGQIRNYGGVCKLIDNE